MDPDRTLLVDRKVLFSQIIDIGKCQSGEAAKGEHVPDSVEPVVGQLPADKRIEFLFGQRNLDVGLVDFHLIVLKRILLDPFVADRIKNEVFQTAKQIDSSVVLTPVRCLHECIQSVDIFVGNGV